MNLLNTSGFDLRPVYLSDSRSLANSVSEFHELRNECISSDSSDETL